MAETREQPGAKARDACRILDAVPEQAFDDLVRLAAHVCNTPMAVLTLMDERRQWFKTTAGMPAMKIDCSLSFCSRTIESDGPFTVPDAGQDPLFAGNPLVAGEPGIRFYTGVPLVAASGLRTGAPAVLDIVPRELNPDQLSMLTALARQATRLLDARRRIGTGPDDTGRPAAEAEKQMLVRDLGERIKELRALHEASSLLRQEHLSVGEVLERVAALLPPAMQHPEIAAARVEFDGQFRTAGMFRKTSRALEADFIVDESRAGRLQLVYLEERPVNDEGPFLVEERRMINSLAEMLRVHFKQMAVAQAREAAIREHERQHAALVELTRSPVWQGTSDATILREITRTIASALDVARVSFWRYSEDRAAIVCRDLFEAATQRHSAGHELLKRDFPHYFQALATSEIIAAEDARSDPRTREFTAAYLEPLGIAAMLDVPVQVAGKLAGVLCLEHVGKPREWKPGERSLAVAAASLLAQALAQSALARSEERLRTILESEPECVKVVSAVGQLLEMNAAGLRMIEAGDRDEVIGMPVRELIHPEYWEAFTQLNRRVCRGETGHLQFRIRGLQGAERWVESHSAPFREADGSISSVLSVTSDITKRKHAEEALRTSEERFRELAENIGDIFYSYDPANNRLLYANRVYERIWG